MKVCWLLEIDEVWESQGYFKLPMALSQLLIIIDYCEDQNDLLRAKSIFLHVNNILE